MMNLTMYTQELDQRNAEASLQKRVERALLIESQPHSRFTQGTGRIVAAALSIGAVVVAIVGVIWI